MYVYSMQTAPISTIGSVVESVSASACRHEIMKTSLNEITLACEVEHACSLYKIIYIRC
jgi:hypothetical protein